MVMGKNIYGYKNTHSTLMGKRYSLVYIIIGKICGMGPQAELFTTEVDGISPIMDGCFQLLKTTRRSQKFAADIFFISWYFHNGLFTEKNVDWFLGLLVECDFFCRLTFFPEGFND